MKTLTKVNLINWHTFSNESFPIHKNTLFTGENGTGKSTVLDAMQYVLTVAQCKFNSAVGDNGKRTIESYMRCKSGVEGKEYLRNGDVSTYVALEFYDEKTRFYQTIGVALDLSTGQQKPNRDFFQINHAKVDEIIFVKENKVLTRSQFKECLTENGQIALFKNGIGDAKNLFANALGVKQKYFDLVTRALAFKAIDNVYQFIMDFLLKEDFVDIQNLRLSIQDYKRLEEQLKVTENECNHLSEINDRINEYHKLKVEIDTLAFTMEKVREKQLLHSIKVDTHEVGKLTQDITTCERRLVELDNNYETYFKQLDNLRNLLNQNEAYKQKEVLEKEYNNLKIEEKKNSHTYSETIHELENESKLFKQLKSQKSFVDYINQKNYSTDQLSLYLQDIKNYVSEKNSELSEEYSEKGRVIKIEKEQCNSNVKRYQALKDNRLSYKKEVQELIDLLKDKLFQHFGKQIDVKPLCEYIEVKNEEWRNALEGYLNTQRFDIILDPEYFEYATLVYEEYKNKHGIFGVGIVDVAKLSKYSEVEAGNTLLQYVSFKNTFAQWYVNMLLKNIVCVEDTKLLRQHTSAITKTAMLYKNYTVRALNPNIYRTPFIGIGAIKIQKKILEDEIHIEKESINRLMLEKQTLESTLKRLHESKVDKLMYQIQIVDVYQNIVLQMEDVKRRISKLEIDDSIFAIQEEYDNVSKAFEDIKKTRTSISEHNGDIKSRKASLEQAIEQNKNNQFTLHEAILEYEMDHLELTQIADDDIVAYEKKFSRNYKLIQQDIDKKKIDCLKYVAKDESEIVGEMNKYNTEFNIGFENSLHATESYIARYHLLRDLDILDKKEKTRLAKLKCEESFKTSFISGLNEKISNAKDDISALNKGLMKRDFNGETYEFCVNPTTKDNFREYYKIIQNGRNYNSNDLLSETLDDSQRRIMDELFAKLANSDNDKDTEKMLQAYTDYRNYLDYDIKINYSNGEFAYFSKVNKEKSGGETQTPFYVIMAASFEQIINVRNTDEDFGCVVIFDEAFNNMDEQRIQEMIKFYNERDIQTFIAVPPSRASTIIPYVNTCLLVIKQGNQSFIEVVRDDEL